MFSAVAETLNRISSKGLLGGNMGPAHGVLLKEIDGLLLPPGIAYTLLTDHLITG